MKDIFIKYAKKCFVTAKVFAPSLTDFKFFLKRTQGKITKNPHESDFRILERFTDHISKDSLFVDVGGNRGQSIESTRLFLNCRIISFEPIPFLATKIENRYRKDHRIKIVNSAISDHVGTLDLFIPWYRNFCFDGIASTIRDQAERWLNPNRMFFYNPSKLRIETISVPCSRLDDFNLEPFFIKIDVQGAELLVLRGARQTIEKHEPIILLERPDQDGEVALLAEFGYNPYFLEEETLVRGVGGHNTFFATQKHEDMLGIRI